MSRHEDPRRRDRFAAAADAFRSTIVDPHLRRAQAAFGVIWASEWCFTVALSVIAFRDGGATAVGVVMTLRMLAAAVLGPAGAALADRMPRERLFAAAAVVRAVATAAAAAAVSTGLEALSVYALAIAATAAFTVIRPAHSALLPLLCRTPQQLTSASVVRGMMDSIGMLVGPAVAAAGLAFASAEAVLAATAAASAWSAVLIMRVVYDSPARTEARRRLMRDAADGFAALIRNREVGVIVGVALAQTFTRGAASVLLVVLAIGALGTGEAGVGVLTAAIGAGAVAGSLGAGLLAGSRALARWEGIGAALWGLPLVGCALVPQEPAVIAFLAAVGVGNALVDVGLFTLPARIVSENVLGRIFGAFETLGALSVALGSLVAPALVSAFGIRGALLVIGLVSPLAVLAGWKHLCRIDRAVAARDGEIELLRSVPMLGALPLPAIETLASRAEPAVVTAGASVFGQGDCPDRFYVIEDGEAEVRRDGVHVASLGPGDGFGEMALIRQSRRTATVRARSELRLRSVEREQFVPAVTGYAQAAGEADRMIEHRAAEMTSATGAGGRLRPISGAQQGADLGRQ